MILFFRRFILLSAFSFSVSVTPFAAESPSRLIISSFRFIIPGVLTNTVNANSGGYSFGSTALDRLDPATGDYANVRVKEVILKGPRSSDALKQWALDTRKGTAVKKALTIEAISVDHGALAFTIKYIGTLPTTYKIEMDSDTGIVETVSLTFEQVLYDPLP